MKLLELVVLVAVTVLAVYIIVRAVASLRATKQDKWKPDVLTDGNSDEIQVVLVRKNREPILIDQPIDKNQDATFRSIEFDNAWKSAEAIAKDMNK